MPIFNKKPFIPPPYKVERSASAPVVFHYRNEVPQVYTLPPEVYLDVPVVLTGIVVKHAGAVSLDPFVWETPHNQYLRLIATVQTQTTTSGPLPGSAIAVRLTSSIDTRDVFFTRERSRQTDGLETDYAFDADGYVYVRAGERISLVVRMLNATHEPVDCTITEAQLLATGEHTLLDRYIS